MGSGTMHSPRDGQGVAAAAAGVAHPALGVATPAAKTRRPISLWLVFCALSSLLLLFMIIAPLIVCLWGSFTTLKVMGAGSERGAGWEQVTTSRDEEKAESQSAAASVDLGVFAKGARNIAGSVTTFWYQYVWEVYGGTLHLSLMLAVISICICIVLGVLGGYALVRYTFFGKNLIEEMILLPLSLPGIAVAVALIETYGVLRGSWVIILFGHLLYTLPFMMQSVTNTLRSFDFVTLEQAASSMGAGPWQRLRYILLPNLKHAIIVGSLLVFAISLGEFNASFLLNTPFNQTFPAALYDSYTNDSFQVSSAATCIFMFIVIPALMAMQLIGGKEMRDIGGA
ncbi:MAG: ABC transporter permease subunit [Rhodospirillales bacterium]|nr:ABC transporter permease subunit [Rhodospirillales bacterium]